ncbi:hypothetical protein [Helicobacter rodentium]|nr:hypothetical protein [Helicobacter rodentium]
MTKWQMLFYGLPQPLMRLRKDRLVCVIARRSRSVCCESNRPTLANP